MNIPDVLPGELAWADQWIRDYDEREAQARLSRLALIYHQRVRGAHNNDDREVACDWCVLAASQHVAAELLEASDA